MKFPVFRDGRHETFYYRMLAERRCADSYHRALFYTLGLSKDTRAHIQELFDFSEVGIKPEGLSASWQTEVLSASVGWRLISGTDGAKRARNGIQPHMSCLIAKLLPTFLKQYGCVIQNMLAN